MREQGDVEGGGAAVHGDGVLHADVRGELWLEGGDARALGELSGCERFRDGAQFVFFDERVGSLITGRHGRLELRDRPARVVRTA